MDDGEDNTVYVMSAAQVRDARKRLGRMWGLGRSLSPDELARELGLGGSQAGRMVSRWEQGYSKPTGPCSRLMQALLAGYRPSQDGYAPEVAVRLPGPSSGLPRGS
jgi:DNA-binding transcriptional regulator YiaG